MNPAIFQAAICVVLASAGELLFKVGITSTGEPDFSTLGTLLASGLKIASNIYIITGVICYGLTAALWLIVLSKLNLSYAYPLFAMTYVLVPLSAHLVLKEHIPLGMWFGIFIIVFGIVVVAQYGS